VNALALALEDAPEIECPFTEPLVRALVPWSHCGTVVSRGEADPADLARRMVTLYPLSVAVCAYRRDILSRACRGVDYAVRVLARNSLVRFAERTADPSNARRILAAADLLSASITVASAPWVGLAVQALYESWVCRNVGVGATATIFDVKTALLWLTSAIYRDDPHALEIAGRCAASFAIHEGARIVVGTWEPAERLVRVTLAQSIGDDHA
jgi:hypothetical protein